MRELFADAGNRPTQSLLSAIFLMLSILASSSALAECRFGKLAEIPITMVGLRPLMTANIDNRDVRFVVDSGAFYSMMSPASAAELNLKTSAAPRGIYVIGANGAAAVSIATVKTFTLAGVPLHNVQFLVGGSDVGEDSVGVLGLNFLGMADAEYDLGQGVVRLMKAEDCGKAFLAYWVKAGTPYSVIDIVPEPQLKKSHLMATAYLNGIAIRVAFDTGAGSSILSLKVAERAGIKPDSPGVVSGGASHGFGQGTFATFIAPFASFKIGDEEIKNARLRFGDITVPNIDMLIGPDFFLSHRIYAANSQHKLYFTYNGGPVFNLTSDNQHDTQTATDAAPSPQQASANPAASGDAADYARRGAALASRHEFDQALAALTRACELTPDNPEYVYTRGTVYLQTQQPDLAMADFNQALKLKPDDLVVLLARARLLLQKGDKAGASADLDAADTVAPKQSDFRYQMSFDYVRADRLQAAVAQITLWMEWHAVDARVGGALVERCRLRALESVDLSLALKDCNAALEHARKSSPFHALVAGTRGLVFLRMADYDKSIADYDVSLKINEKNAWALYGRGIDKLRKQDTAGAEADMAAAKALLPQVAEEFSRRGIVP